MFLDSEEEWSCAAELSPRSVIDLMQLQYLTLNTFLKWMKNHLTFWNMSRVIKVHQPTDIWLNLTEKDFKDIKWKILLCEGYDLETSLDTRYKQSQS